MTKNQQNALLHITELSHSYADKQVLDSINLELCGGEIFGLVGLNGIGKTTMIKSITTLLEPDAGNIKLLGHDNNAIQGRRAFAYLPEKFSPSRNLLGREFIEFTLAFYNKPYDAQKASQMCEALDLPPIMLNKFIKSYSKGMGQKLGLIAVLLTEASILILDEPMSGLDPKARVALKKLLLDYVSGSNGRMIFFSSHIMADIEEICTNIGILHNTKMIYKGGVKDFLKLVQSNDLERGFLDIISEKHVA